MTKFSGQGTITYDNGDVYDGVFANSEPDGIGKMTHKDGRICEGIWENGKIKYEGGLVNGKPHGRGKMIKLSSYTVLQINLDGILLKKCSSFSHVFLCSSLVPGHPVTQSE